MMKDERMPGLNDQGTSEKAQGILIIFAAHSGAGKSTIINRLLEKHSDWKFSISCTTRAPRQGEKDGREYYFITHERFDEMVRNGKLMEYENVHGEYYGTPSEPLDAAVRNGEVMILDLDVYGALNVRSAYPDNSRGIFIDVSDLAVLEKRLLSRKTESTDKIAARLSRIPAEREKIKGFDYIVLNDDLEKAVEQTDKIIVENR